jgi:uncharacterized membrane protein YdbT with pleckstrin-like domain
MDPEPGEQVFFHGHPSWRSMLGLHLTGLLVAILAGAIAGVVTAIVDGSVKALWVAVAVAVVLAAVVLFGLFRRLTTTYTITDQRLTIDHGFLSRDVRETRVERIQNVNCAQSLLERMLRVGTVDFDTAGSAEYDFAFRGVAAPRQIARTVDRVLHQLEAGER